jgi:hypothetical protein
MRTRQQKIDKLVNYYDSYRVLQSCKNLGIYMEGGTMHMGVGTEERYDDSYARNITFEMNNLTDFDIDLLLRDLGDNEIDSEE